MTETFVTMDDGARLHVELLGGDDPRKPLLIAHHGAPGVSNLSEPRSSFGFLADRFRVLVHDARGSGASDAAGPLTHARWAADVDGLRRWAGAERIVMAGGSYGGFIAMEYALAYPAHVLAVVLRDTSAEGASLRGYATERALQSGLPIDRARLDRMFTGTMLDDADMEACLAEVAQLYVGTARPDPATPVAPRTTTIRAPTHNAAFSQNLPRYDITARLGEIRAPTLITVGRHDWITPVACSERIHAGIAGSELVIFEESGHSPPADEPARFRRIVRDFLDRHVPA